MKQYRDGFREKLKPRLDNLDNTMKVEPFRDAQFALRKATFATREKEDFFNEAYVEILTHYFTAWLKSEPHATKEREYLYSCAMSLGAVKQQLTEFEQLGKNAAFLNVKQNESDESNEL